MKTAEVILENEWNKNKNNCPFNEIYIREKIAINNAMIEFAKMHVQEALKQASEKADADFTYLGDDLKEIGAEYIEVYTIKDSILNAYPLDLIK